MSDIYRIIDANFNRAKEAWRVIEDICRFILDEEFLTAEIKSLRNGLTAAMDVADRRLLAARGSETDVARDRSVPNRKNTKQVLLANFKRLQEALRVLEEFIADSDQIKDLRYKAYDLEKIIYKKLILKLPFERDVYVVSDNIEVLKQAVMDGAAIVQLRDKTEDLQKIEQNALQIIEFLKDKEAVFILNDYPELALKVGADGVHVGQDDLSVAEVRKIVGTDFIIGKTTHNIEQGLKAQSDGANYISVGPIYETPTKPGRQAVGLEYLREAAAKINIPFVSIGGIDLDNLDDVLTAGAKTIGIVRAAGETKKFLENISPAGIR